VTAQRKWSETSCSACERRRGGIPISSMVICAAVKQCKVRWKEHIRALWTCYTWVGWGRYLRFWVACERTHDRQMRYRISGLVRVPRKLAGVSCLRLCAIAETVW